MSQAAETIKRGSEKVIEYNGKAPKEFGET